MLSGRAPPKNSWKTSITPQTIESTRTDLPCVVQVINLLVFQFMKVIFVKKLIYRMSYGVCNLPTAKLRLKRKYFTRTA